MEPTTNPELIPLDIIEPGTEVTITVTDELYKRLQDIIFNYLPFKDMTHFTTVIAEINSGTYKDPLCNVVHTLLWLTNLYEDAAKAQGKISKKQWSVTDKKIID